MVINNVYIMIEHNSDPVTSLRSNYSCCSPLGNQVVRAEVDHCFRFRRVCSSSSLSSLTTSSFNSLGFHLYFAIIFDSSSTLSRSLLMFPLITIWVFIAPFSSTFLESGQFSISHFFYMTGLFQHTRHEFHRKIFLHSNLHS